MRSHVVAGLRVRFKSGTKLVWEALNQCSQVCSVYEASFDNVSLRWILSMYRHWSPEITSTDLVAGGPACSHCYEGVTGEPLRHISAAR